MAADPSPSPHVVDKLSLAMVSMSDAPLLLLDGDLRVIAASRSFCQAFRIDPERVTGVPVFALGEGRWNLPRLRSLLTATASGQAAVDAYEMDIRGEGRETRILVVKAQKLEYDDAVTRVLMTVTDITDARRTARANNDLLREKAVLLQEIQHRVANSLQIIASVLLQSARTVRSDESRVHLHDAHSRVMSIAAAQKHLASAGEGSVALRPYFTQLCQSLGASMIRDHDKQSIEVTGDDSVVGADISVSLGLIVTELVINCLKHAFPDQRAGKITVDYRAAGSDWTLSVGDDGVGMPVNGADAKPGLGSSIVEALARQLKAQVEVADARPGVRILVVHTRASEVELETALEAV